VLLLLMALAVGCQAGGTRRGGIELELEIAGDTLKLFWNPVPGADLYRVKKTGGGGLEPGALCCDTFYVDVGLPPWGVYSVEAVEIRMSVSALERRLWNSAGSQRWSARESAVLFQREAGGTHMRREIRGGAGLGPSADSGLGPAPNPYSKLVARNGRIAAFDHRDSLIVLLECPSQDRDPLSGLFDGGFGIVGADPAFDFRAFAVAHGWRIEETDSLLIIERALSYGAGGIELRHEIDRSTNLITGTVYDYGHKRNRIRNAYRIQEGIPVLHHRWKHMLVGDSLAGTILWEYTDVVFNEDSLNLDPAALAMPEKLDLTDRFKQPPVLPDSSACFSDCPEIRALETEIDRAPASCYDCHGQIPPITVALLHGINSSPQVFPIYRRWLEEFYDVTVFSPSYPSCVDATDATAIVHQQFTLIGLPLDLAIGHSLGGLILRNESRIHADSPVRWIMTIGTPHRGAAIAANLQQALASLADLVTDGFDALATALLPAVIYVVGLPAGIAVYLFLDYLEGRVLGHIGELFSGAALPDLVPGSPFLTELNSEPIDIPITGICLDASYYTPIQEILAARLSEDEIFEWADDYQIPYQQLDYVREEAYNFVCNVWSALVALTDGFGWCDPIHDFHWALTHVNGDWYNMVLEAVDENVAVPLYSYYEPGDGPGAMVCFYCPYTPEILSGGLRESCCRFMGEDSETGADFYCCWGCGEGAVVRCFHGYDYVDQPLPHDSIVRRFSQEVPEDASCSVQNIHVGGVSHNAETRSYRILLVIEELFTDRSGFLEAESGLRAPLQEIGE